MGGLPLSSIPGILQEKLQSYWFYIYVRKAMGLDMIWTGTKRSKAMYIWRRGRKAGLDTETSL